MIERAHTFGVGARRRAALWLTGSVLVLVGAIAVVPVIAGPAPDFKPPKEQAKGEPQEDIWAIRCIEVPGPTRFQLAKSYGDALRKVKGLKADLVQVIDSEGTSVVYYGHYKQVYEGGRESFKPDPKSDLDLIRPLSFMSPNGDGTATPVWPFYLASIETLPTASSVPGEWNLLKARGYWSLQVGVFYNQGEMRQRRYAAEQYCKLLRDQGQEAYFHHATERSAVFVGAYPREAIVETRRANPLTGASEFSMKIVDEKMLDAQRKNPYNVENGAVMYDVEVDPKTGEKTKTPHPSFAVEIPHDQAPAAPPAPKPLKKNPR